MDTRTTDTNFKRYNRTLWKIVLGCIAAFVVFISLMAVGVFGALPSFRDIENPKSNQASEILSDDGTTLGTYFVQNRSNISYKDISPNVIHALIATEDVRFKEHSGIDFKRTFTIFFYNLAGRKQGGSTITQQLALNLFSENGREHGFLKRVLQKFKEWIVAVKLERNYTKEEIITMYLNTVDFGNNAWGIKSAASVYYNTTPEKLTPRQAAVLVGILKGVTMYSPTRNPDKAMQRSNFIMHRMLEANFLSQEEYDRYKETPLGLKLNPASVNDGIAPYFRAVLKSEIKKIFKDKAIYKADGTPYDLDRDGLKVYTTLNYDMQRYAEAAQKEYMRVLQNQFTASWKGKNVFGDKNKELDAGVKRSDRYRQLKLEGKTDAEIKKNFNTRTRINIFTWNGDKQVEITPLDSVKYYKMLLRNAIMALDPQTGYVKCWVGGNNYDHFKYDQVMMGKRQVGSTAKPFTYAVAIENGFSPCYSVANVPVTITGFGEPWTPRSSGTIGGYLTLQKALAFSQNYVTAFLMKQVGPVAVANLATRLGVPDVPAYPSIALGSFDASLFSMVGAYGAFANKGVRMEPTFLLKITDKNGTVLYQKHTIPVPVLNEKVSYVMTRMLRGVVQNGTGSRLSYKYGVNTPIGGKTGTTNDNSDGWFIAITPQLVTGVWTGCEDRAFHFASTSLGEGANTALPIFAGFIKRVYADKRLKISKDDFAAPVGGTDIVYDCNQYSRPAPAPDTTAAKSEVLDEKLGF